MTQLTEQVKQNLQYYTLWSDVAVHQFPTPRVAQKPKPVPSNGPELSSNEYTTYLRQNLTEELEILSGYPPQKLSSSDSEHMLEWVVPVLINSQDNLSVKTINYWFSQIELKFGTRPRRLTIALVNLDSTIVYYFVHDGIVKPEQN